MIVLLVILLSLAGGALVAIYRKNQFLWRQLVTVVAAETATPSVQRALGKEPTPKTQEDLAAERREQRIRQSLWR